MKRPESELNEFQDAFPWSREYTLDIEHGEFVRETLDDTAEVIDKLNAMLDAYFIGLDYGFIDGYTHNA